MVRETKLRECDVDLGISGRKAIVCASSRGLGRGCALALAEAGVHLTINGRNEQALEATAAEIKRISGLTPHVVLADVSTKAGQDVPIPIFWSTTMAARRQRGSARSTVRR